MPLRLPTHQAHEYIPCKWICMKMLQIWPEFILLFWASNSQVVKGWIGLGGEVCDKLDQLFLIGKVLMGDLTSGEIRV